MLLDGRSHTPRQVCPHLILDLARTAPRAYCGTIPQSVPKDDRVPKRCGRGAPSEHREDAAVGCARKKFISCATPRVQPLLPDELGPALPELYGESPGQCGT